MNDLELCKRVAEIEGYELSDEQDYKTYHLFPNICSIKKNRCDDGVDWVDHVQYNPLSLSDKTLLWDLMVKYRINITHWLNKRKGGYVWTEEFKCNIEDDSEIPRATLECIVMANNGAKA